MTPKLTTNDRIEVLASRDERYAPDAYHFVFETLDFVLEVQANASRQHLSDDRHISVGQLLDGLRNYAIHQYGPLARLVLQRWGIYTTEDFGEIVFRLVDSRLLNKQETDRKSDFRNGFNFREAFDKAWRSTPKLRA